MYCFWYSSPILTNSIITHSTLGIGIECGPEGINTPNVMYCDVYGNAAGEYFGVTPGTGCTWVEPMFVDAAGGDFHLASPAGHYDPATGTFVTGDPFYSPCIDAGDPASDFSNEPDPNGGRANMGAFGNTPQASKTPAAPTSVWVDDDWDGPWNSGGHAWGYDAFASVQAAIDACAAGGTVTVLPGTYVENIGLNGKAVTVTSTDPLDPAVVESTILDGGGSGIVAFFHMVGRDAAIAGFTIRNGDSPDAGGVACYDASPTISHNTIVDNTSSSGAGGIRCYDSSAAVDSSPLISHNRIARNTGYQGGGIFCRWSSPAIEHSIIAANGATNAGGGMYLERSAAQVTYTTLSNNSAIYGGNVYCDSDVSPTFTNSIIAFAAGGSGIFCVAPCLAPPVLAYCNVYGNVGGDFDFMPDPVGTNGNISLDPLFADAANGDYHLMSPAGRYDPAIGAFVTTDTAYSPCIDAGDPADPFSNEPAPNGFRVNIGAYGATQQASKSLSPPTAVWVDDDWNGPGNCGGHVWMHEAFRVIQHGMDACVSGGTVTVHPGTYVENIDFRGKAITVTGTDPTNQSVVDLTVIDGGASGSVVTFASGEGPGSVITGFKITNGSGTLGGLSDPPSDFVGGGIYCEGASPTISRNRITGNVVEDAGPMEGLGGGIYCAHSSATISNCQVTHNSAEAGGGGIADVYGSLTVTDCQFTDNTGGFSGGATVAQASSSYTRCSFSRNQAESNGGLSVTGTPGAVFTDCLIEANSSLGTSGSGGGVMVAAATLADCTIRSNVSRWGGGLWTGPDSVVEDCTIVNNVAIEDGGGVYATYGLSMRHCTLVGNVSGQHGGGLAFAGAPSGASSRASVDACTFVANSATGVGGGVAYVSPDYNPFVLTNSIIVFSANGGGIGDAVGPGSDFTVSYCDSYGNVGGEYLGMPDLTGTAGNISENPLFADSANGDYHLKSKCGRWDPLAADWVTDSDHSPCIDAADPTHDWSAEPEGNGDRANMGMYANTLEASKSCAVLPITSIDPTSGDDSGSVVMTIEGLGFESPMTVSLERVGEPSAVADWVNIIGQDRLTCSLNLRGAAEGLWGVRVSTGSGWSGVLDGAFTVHHVLTLTDGPAGSPNPVAPSEDVACTVTVDDSHAHTLAYLWSATDGGGATAGVFDAPTAHNPTWTAPDNGSDTPADYTISVLVSCTEGETVSGQFVQQVSPLLHVVTITDGPSGIPNPVASGGDVVCTVTASDSRPGHSLSYAWTAVDGGGAPAGSFDNAAQRNSVWTAPANTTGAAHEYTLEVTVTCDGSPSESAQASYTQHVDPLPHELDLTAGPEGTPNGVPSGGNVQCSATATDSHGHGVEYQWTAVDGDDSPAGSFDAASSQNPTWTAPVNDTDHGALYIITVAATCSADPSLTIQAGYAQRVFPADHQIAIDSGPVGNPNPVASGGVVNCDVSATDSRGHGLLYAWSAVDDNGASAGTFTSANTASPAWNAPANTTDVAQDYTIRATVTCPDDNTISATATYLQRVLPAAHVLQITDGPSGAPNPTVSGGDVACSVQFADSRDGHSHEFQWTARDQAGVSAGSFDDAGAAAPTWTAPANPSDAAAAYALEVTVTCIQDRTVSDSGSFQVHLLPAAHDLAITVGPNAVPNPAPSGVDVACSVATADTRGHGVTYQWSATDAAGAPAGSFDDPNAQNPNWTPPIHGGTSNRSYTLWVTATCDQGLSRVGQVAVQVQPAAHLMTITVGPTALPAVVGSGGSVACNVAAEDSAGHLVQYAWTATNSAGAPVGRFDDSTAQNPAWTAPLVVAPTDVTIGCTASCAQGAMDTATCRVTVMPGASHLFQPGVRMVSVPAQPFDPDPAQMGFVGVAWCRWNAMRRDYVYYSADPGHFTWFEPAEDTPGKGYWARFGGATPCEIVGAPVPPDAPWVVPLTCYQGPSWDQIGCPYDTAVPWKVSGAGAICVRHSGQELTLAQARAEGWCADYAMTFVPGVGYEVVYDTDVWADAPHDALEPWEGYWFLANVPCELIFPARNALPARAPSATGQSADWMVTLLASADGQVQSRVTVGQAQAARIIATPPAFAEAVQLLLAGDGLPASVDLRDRKAGTTWSLEAETIVAGASAVLTWPDMSSLPMEYRPVLTDETTGKRVYLRTSRQLAFTCGDAGSARRFRLELAPPASEQLVVVSATAAPTASGGLDIRIRLSAAATVDAQLVNVAGRTVASICRARDCESGVTSLTFSGIGATGTRLPAGRYLARITARTDTGQQASTVCSVQLGR